LLLPRAIFHEGVTRPSTPPFLLLFFHPREAVKPFLYSTCLRIPAARVSSPRFNKILPVCSFPTPPFCPVLFQIPFFSPSVSPSPLSSQNCSRRPPIFPTLFPPFSSDFPPPSGTKHRAFSLYFFSPLRLSSPPHSPPPSTPHFACAPDRLSADSPPQFFKTPFLPWEIPVVIRFFPFRAIPSSPPTTHFPFRPFCVELCPEVEGRPLTFFFPNRVTIPPFVHDLRTLCLCPPSFLPCFAANPLHRHSPQGPLF